jgi:hypothetical protein
VSDGDPGCEPLKSKSFDVTCPGVDLCEGVICDDTGNECTAEECNPANGLCEVVNLDGNECNAGGGSVDVADNGGVEEGTLNGWEATFCTPPDFSGPCTADNTMPNTGDWAVRMFNDVRATPSVLKQANKAVGLVQPDSQVTVRFAAKGFFGPGGVAFAEFFSELAGGGTSKAEILGGGPILVADTPEYQLFEFTVTTGPDVSGGITLQFNAATADIEGSTAELFVDDVVILVEGGGVGICDSGVCVPSDLCEGVDCDDQNECTVDACNPSDGSCTNTADPGASCDGGAGTCDAAGVCQPNDLCSGVDCDDQNECTIDVCDPADGSCSNTPDDGASCDGGAGTCDAAGVCQPNAEVLYEENFESLDQTSGTALGTAPGGAGFLVFGNEFQPDGTPIQGYGPFSAPNGTPGFCSIALGQGGDPQGAQVLVIYSDYNNGANQEAGNLVEANTFQERTIGAADVGTTWVFSFDAKRGDINDPANDNCINTPNPPCDSTAVAFIKTLAPPAFNQTNFITLDTTNLPTNWDRYSIELEIIPELEGQIIQWGFAATATNFEPSGVFYDNLLVVAQ